MELIKKFTVYRDKWLRGSTSEGSKLLRSDGMMCCVGQYLEQCGVPRELLLNNAYAAELMAKVDIIEKEPFPASIYSTNDDNNINDITRERRLTAYFSNIYDIDVEFVDE